MKILVTLFLLSCCLAQGEVIRPKRAPITAIVSEPDPGMHAVCVSFGAKADAQLKLCVINERLNVTKLKGDVRLLVQTNDRYR